MNTSWLSWLLVGLSSASLAACIAETSAFGEDDDDGGSATASSSGTGGDSAGGGNPTGSGNGPSTSSSGGAGGGVAVAGDPNLDGPYAVAELDETVSVPATGTQVAIHCAHPTSAADGPYPVVLVGHGFNLPPTQYKSYVRRLATHGYVAMTVDFNAGFTGVDHVANAEELLHGIDWAAAHGTLSPLSDTQNVGATGHSLGGKVALLAATMDARIRASITLDPVDGGMSCSPTKCPDVSAMLPIGIPTAFLGETIDATGAFQACAPAAHNFQTFFANAGTPSVAIQVLGANHMSFLDDVSSCGFTCSLCNAATTDNATVNALSRAFVVAFYGRYLKNDAGFDTFLTGAEAQARYVSTGLVSITTK